MMRIKHEQMISLYIFLNDKPKKLLEKYAGAETILQYLLITVTSTLSFPMPRPRPAVSKINFLNLKNAKFLLNLKIKRISTVENRTLLHRKESIPTRLIKFKISTKDRNNILLQTCVNFLINRLFVLTKYK